MAGPAGIWAAGLVKSSWGWGGGEWAEGGCRYWVWDTCIAELLRFHLVGHFSFLRSVFLLLKK